LAFADHHPLLLVESAELFADSEISNFTICGE